ncbi:MAG: hypothetical protein NVS1B13_02750 [Flavisolibacter sp.]
MKLNIKEYISSGIIESYVLGMATEAEAREFEIICLSHPEVAEARNNFEIALENKLLEEAIEVPTHLKKQIEEHISYSGAVIKDMGQQNGSPNRTIARWKWMAAASFILMAGALMWAFNTYSNLDRLAASNLDLQNKLKRTNESLTLIRQDEAMLHKPGIKMAALHSTTSSAAYATIYWDTTSKDVYLMVNNLPQPAADQQYQLWALLEGKPIDLGVFAPHQEKLLVRMKNVQNAEAFAITLEPQGGSITPTSQPLVLAKL